MQPALVPDSAHSAFGASHTPVGELATAHARTLEKAVAAAFERQTRRMPFATTASVCGLAAGLMQEFGEDLLNDLLILAERRTGTLGPEWVMAQLAEALVDGASALEEAAPPAVRPSVSNVLQICRVDFEWRCRATLGLPNAGALEARG